MPSAVPIQSSFNGGEFSPLMMGRIDYEKYKNGLTFMQNFVPQVQGGATRRVGSYYIQPTKSNAQARLVPFVFSNGDAIMIEFTDSLLRFYRNRLPIETSPGVAYELASPYLLADLQYLRFQQSKDVMYIAHPSYKPKKLSRASLTSWSFSDVDFKDGPYLQINSTTTTLTPSATTGTTITLTASSTTGINGGAGFKSTDVGRLVRLQHSSTWGWGKITAFTSTTVVTVDNSTEGSAFGGTTAVSTWRLGEWSDTTGYPSVVFSFEDRLGWAASPADPILMNMSKTGDYENMAPTGTDSVVSADNALQLRLNSKEQDPIRWVFDNEQGLLAGTKGAEYVVRSSTTGVAMSAISFPSARRSTKYGSANIEPVEVGKAILFVQTLQRKLREMAYVYNVDGFLAPDLTLIAEHATKGKIAQLAYQQEPFSVLWSRMEDGSLWGMTYDRDQKALGWHRHYFGGYSDSAQTAAPIIESIACLPAPDGSQDDLWLVIRRHINGADVRFVEYLTNFNSAYDSVADCFFVDAGRTITVGAPTTAVTGLDYLEGQSVDLLVDGSPQVAKTVSSGAITLDRAATAKIQVGLGYRSRMKTLRPDAGAADGTAQSKTKRTHRLFARFHQTVGIWVGRDFDVDPITGVSTGVPMDVQDFREGNHLMGAPVDMFDGDKKLDYEDDYNTDGYMCFETRQPLPCTILALMPRIQTQDV